MLIVDVSSSKMVEVYDGVVDGVIIVAVTPDGDNVRRIDCDPDCVIDACEKEAVVCRADTVLEVASVRVEAGVTLIDGDLTREWVSEFSLVAVLVLVHSITSYGRFPRTQEPKKFMRLHRVLFT